MVRHGWDRNPLICNGLLSLAFQSWVGRNPALDSYIWTPRLRVLESSNHNCSTLTVSMSHYMCIEWWGMVKIEIHWFAMVSSVWYFSHGWEEIQPWSPTFEHQDCLQHLDWSNVSSYVYWMMRHGWDRNPLICNGLLRLAFQSWVGRNLEKSSLGFLQFNTKIACLGAIKP